MTSPEFSDNVLEGCQRVPLTLEEAVSNKWGAARYARAPLYRRVVDRINPLMLRGLATNH
jgi:hypothetical protein